MESGSQGLIFTIINVVGLVVIWDIVRKVLELTRLMSDVVDKISGLITVAVECTDNPELKVTMSKNKEGK